MGFFHHWLYKLKKYEFGRFLYTKLKYLPPVSVPLKCKSCDSEKNEQKKYLKIFFFITKKDKDEFNTILKHLIKLVKNF